jgi:hypothetical protein
VFHWLTARRRAHLLETPFPVAWTELLDHNVAAYARLDAEHQARLRDLVQVFVAEKRFEGAAGFEIDDEVRVTIAGNGCLMLLARDHDLFADVLTIIVYPSTIALPERPRAFFDPTMAVWKEDRAVLGVTRPHDPVVLTWDAIRHGAHRARDGHNVVIHELAHKIDFLDGSVDGTPPLPDRAARQAWAHAFEPAFLRHEERAARGEPSFLDDYAITNEAEYFAVASEAYFERPRELAHALPEVYAQLRAFYRLELA